MYLLLTHVARNADANAGVIEAAQRGELVPMYPGGREQREGAIAAGQGRPAADLVTDVRAAHERLERAWATTSDELWATGLGLRSGGRATLPDFVFSRWREVEVVRGRGAPTIALHGRYAARAEQLGVERVHVSLTHGRDSAVAFAVAEAAGE